MVREIARATLGKHTANAMQIIKTISDAGKGRPFVIIHEQEAYTEFSARVSQALSERTRTVLLECSRVDDSNWRELSRLLLSKLTELGVRQASFVGFGAAAALVQNVCLEDLKLVRTAAFVDAASRAHPSRFARIIDRLERSLPLGLPLRLRSQGFDAKPYLQRIRCPALVVTTREAGAFLRTEAELLEAKLPTSWRLDLTEQDEAGELARQILDFQEVPARCPQKRSAR